MPPYASSSGKGSSAGSRRGAAVHVARRLPTSSTRGSSWVILADGGWKYLSADFWEVAADDVGESMESTVWW